MNFRAGRAGHKWRGGRALAEIAKGLHDPSGLVPARRHLRIFAPRGVIASTSANGVPLSQP